MISFVGAGPGAADLITLRGAQRLVGAEVVIWASSLVPEQLIEAHCTPDAKIHDSATMTLEDVLGVYDAYPDETAIVRLHSGDPSIYGAIGEQIDWCLSNDRSFEIIPGVSSVSAASALLHRELTQPGVSQSVILTRLAGRTHESVPEGQSLGSLAAGASGATMAVFLSAARPDELQTELLSNGAGYDSTTPAVIVIRATWPDEQIIRTTVGNLAHDLKASGTTLTVLVLVGASLSEQPVARRSHLYDPAHNTTYRLPSTPGTTEGRPSARRR